MVIAKQEYQQQQQQATTASNNSNNSNIGQHLKTLTNLINAKRWGNKKIALYKTKLGLIEKLGQGWREWKVEQLIAINFENDFEIIFVWRRL